MRRSSGIRAGAVLLVAVGIATLQPASMPALGAGAVSLEAGGAHTCAITSSGGLLCWGDNSDGELGDGTTINRSAPVDVVGLDAGVASVAPGLDHTCALTAAGLAKCWGQGGDGQLGDGLRLTSSVPVDVLGLDGAAAIEAGYWHTCAVTGAGTVKCWGLNWYGQLGDGTTGVGSTAVEVLDSGSPLTGITAVAAGLEHTCAVTAAQTVKCWGWNQSGQLGADVAELCQGAPCSTSPVEVLDEGGSPLTGAVAIEAGLNYSCALMSTGEVQCWGANEVGQLGNGTSTGSQVPVTVVGLAGAQAISIFGVTTCALTAAGKVLCWGSNLSGQLGNGTTSGFDPNPLPSTVQGLASSAAAVSAAGEHTCALPTGGGAKCWGDNWFGELGDGTTADSTLPVDVLLKPDGDADGCTDGQELGANPAAGGLRDPDNFWDFFDVPTGNPPVKDRIVNIGDIGAVVARFGTNGDPGIDPLSTPPASGYHTAYDRDGPILGADLWDLLPPNGSINVGDIGAVVTQFGHSCSG